MLRGMRKASTNWLGKLVMGAVVGLLVVSFAIWGIGDIFRGFGRSTVAKVGGTEITIDQFRQLYNDRLQQLGRQFGRPITLGAGARLGLRPPDRSASSSPRSCSTSTRASCGSASPTPRSRAASGRPDLPGTDRPVRPRTLRAAHPRRPATPRRASSPSSAAACCAASSATRWSAAPIVPKASVEAANRYQNEQRSIEYVLFDRAQAGEIPAPTPEVLAKYYDERKTLFRAPEYRKIVVISLLPAE